MRSSLRGRLAEASLQFRRFFLVPLGLASLVTLISCGMLKEAAEKAGVSTNMKFAGTVKKALEPDIGIEGATVRLIQLANMDAIKNLIEYKKVPNGEGGKKDVIRIKFDKVHTYKANYETKTDANGKWELKDIPLNLYLVYTFGPGETPGAAGSYGVHFWGINTETGELDEKNLIGVDAKFDQSNSQMLLAGGPTPPPAPIPEDPPAPVAPSVAPTETVPTEPKTANKALPEETVAPTADKSFWTSVKLTHAGGSLGTGGTLTSDSISLESGKTWFDVEATLATAQKEPVYLVMQIGFNSKYTKGCGTVVSDAKTVVYPVKPNGTSVSYKLVPPGSYYKFYFAKTATKTDGAPVDSSTATDTITVGNRSCEKAKPARPFVATLSWDKDGTDLDIHLIKLDRSLIANSPQASQIDTANWMAPTGTSVSLDVDNIQGYGPEVVGEASSVTKFNNYCYKIMVNYYAGSGEVTPTVDIVHTATAGGGIEVNQYSQHKTLAAPGDWWSVGVFPPDCESADAPKSGVLTADDHAQISGHYYNPSWGNMLINFDGTTFKATYAYREGTVTGTYNAAEQKITGWWCEVAGGNRTSAAGEVEYKFIADEQGVVSLDGRWKTGTTGSWDENWDLKETADSPEQALLARMNTASAFCKHP